MIYSEDAKKAETAKEWIQTIVAEPEIGQIYIGKVVKLMDFGAFVEIMPGKEGMVHISQIKEDRVENISDELEEGQTIKVKLTEIDDRGRLNLTMRGIEQPK
jgi:polyribonucleotide nucleotidyltransferase